ncbi:MAG: ATP:cob(I)alamin adenosyltransferase, partial [Myxococcales bacterium]|nr:ATP:cob(I)alamin adenosyltransferase [Myxococcales bacterium]
VGCLLATLPADIHPQMPRVDGTDVTWLEKSIDTANAHLPALRSFVLPGGNRANVDLHLARTVCRRAERLCVTLARREPELDPFVVPYLNRLSDALFVWSRAAAHLAGDEEVLWAPNEA